MASSKRDRASMREGPLSELFRRTEKASKPEAESTPEPPAQAPTPPPADPDPEPAAEHTDAATPAGRDYPHPSLGADGPEAEAERRVPTPQERLRSAFSSDLPENLLDSGEPRRTHVPAPTPP